MPTYTVEQLTVDGTWEVWATNFSYQEAANLCFNVIGIFEMEVCRIVQE